MTSSNPNFEVLDKLLADILLCTNKCTLNLWLECGTLLGMIRDSDYIPWEDDLDFGAFKNLVVQEQQVEISATLRGKGYEVKIYDSYWHIAVPNSICHADINFYSIENHSLAIVPLTGPGSSIAAKIVDSLRRIVMQKPLGVDNKSKRLRDIIKALLQNMCSIIPMGVTNVIGDFLENLLVALSVDISWRVPVRYLKEFKSIKFRGYDVDVPASSEEYLAYRYGEDWETPRKEYNTWKEDGTIV